MNNTINIPFDVNNFHFFLIDHNLQTPIENPSLPLGVGMNNNIQYDLGGYIRINKNLLSSEIVSATLYISGNQSVGDIYVYPHSSGTFSSHASPTNFDYELSIKDTYDNSSDGFVFRLETDLFITRYTVFDVNSIYLILEFAEPLIDETYIDLVESKIRYKIGDYFDKSKIVIKAKSGIKIRTIYSFIPSITDLTQINSSVLSLTVSFKIGSSNYSNTINIDAFNNCWIDESYDSNIQNPVKSASAKICDIILPEDITEAPQNGYPVIVTIHGGNFTDGDKEYYNYITPFLINNGCIHVNMNYTLMSISIENDIYTNTNGIHYQNMLEDIQSLIQHLYDNRKTDSKPNGYPIDISRITIMGHSAGGNLALVYGLSHFVYEDPINLYNSIPFKAIITEGAPTFSELEDDNSGGIKYGDNAYVKDPDICSMMKCLLGKDNTISMNDIHILQPQEYIDSNNLPSILILMMQGTGCYHVNDQEEQNINGDSIVPLVDAQVVKNIDNLVNLLSIGQCSHNDYRILFLNNTTVTQGDNGGYRDQVEITALN